MSQLVSPSGLREDSPGNTVRSACVVSGQRLCLAKGLQVNPGAWGRGQRHCLLASLPFNLQEGRARSGPGEWRGHPGFWVAVCAPPGSAHSGAGELLAPSSLQLERSSQPPRDLGRGLMALLTTDASSLRNRLLLCVSSPHSGLPRGA